MTSKAETPAQHVMPFFRRPDVKREIETLTRRTDLTVILGAGIGVEVGLPDWNTLVRRLLLIAVAGETAAAKGVSEDARELVDLVLRREGVMGAATIARGRLGTNFETAIKSALYGRTWPDDTTLERPTRGYGSRATTGSTAEAVAALYSACLQRGHRCEIATTNYDLTLEDAVEAAIGMKVTPWMKEENPRRGHVIRHLHGVLPLEGSPRAVILTEAEYHSTGKNGHLSWQEAYLRRRLRESKVLFVGTSLTDVDLLSFIFRYAVKREPPVAALIRSTDPGRKADVFDSGTQQHQSYEELQAARWAQTNVRVLGADYYSQPKQLIWEVAYHKTAQAPVRYGKRLDQWYCDAVRGLPLGLVDAEQFEACQASGQRLAETWLEAVMELIREAGFALPDDEQLAIHIWCRTPSRLILGPPEGAELSALAMIVCSDRMWRTPQGIDVRRVMLPSRRVAIEAFCSGRVMRHDTGGGYQWNHVLGIPIVLRRSHGFERIPVGTITLQSTEADGILKKMANEAPEELQNVVDYLQGVGDAFLSTDR
jgi:hypothetical protein